MKKRNKIILYDLQKQRQYRTLLHKELREANEFSNVNEEWEFIRSKIVATAEEVVQTRVQVPRKMFGATMTVGEQQKTKIKPHKNS
jgi:hypothetical protein